MFYCPSSNICTRVISLLQMKGSTLEEWHWLPRISSHNWRTCVQPWLWTLLPGRWTHPSHPGPHRISCMGPAGMLGMVEARPSLNGHYCSCGHWTGENNGIKKIAALDTANAWWLAKGGPINNQSISCGGCHLIVFSQQGQLHRGYWIELLSQRLSYDCVLLLAPCRGLYCRRGTQWDQPNWTVWTLGYYLPPPDES